MVDQLEDPDPMMLNAEFQEVAASFCSKRPSQVTSLQA